MTYVSPRSPEAPKVSKVQIPHPNSTVRKTPVFSFIDATSAKEFGAELARFYMERMPLNTALKDKQFAAKSLKIIDQMDLQVKTYRQKNRLNFYKVAQMGNAFKWALKDAGYEDAYIDKLTQWLVVAVKS